MTNEEFLERIEGGDRDFSGQDLSGVRVTGKNIAGACLDRANIDGVRLIRCDLKGASLLDVEMGERKPDLSMADLTGAHLRGHWHKLVMNAACVDKATLEGSYDGATFKTTTFKKTVMKGCSATEAFFDSCTFMDTDLEGATLQKCGFVGCHFKDVNLSKIDLTGSFFKFCEFFEGVNWNGAVLKDVSGLEEVSADQESDQPFELLGCLIEEEPDTPAELDQAMRELVDMEAELLDRTSRTLSGIKYFAISPETPFPSEDTQEFERALFDFGKHFFPEELEFQQNGSEEFEGDPHTLKTLDAEEFKSWVTKYIHNDSTNEAAVELGLDQSEREEALQTFLKTAAELLLSDSKTIRLYDLADEMNNENIEFGVYLAVGSGAAISFTRRWLL